MRKIKCVALFCCAVLLSCEFVGAADSLNTGFRTTSFIPERFVDLEWKLDLGAGGTYLFAPRENSNGDDSRSYSENSDGSKLAEFHSRTEYRNATLARTYELSLNVDLAYEARTRVYSRDYFQRYDSNTREGTNNLDWRQEYVRVSMVPSLGHSRYLIGDLEIGLSLTPGYAYEMPVKDRRKDYGQVSYEYGDTLSYTAQGMSAQYSPIHLHEYSLQVETHAAWGRIYSGRYAVTANELLKALRSAGLLLKEPVSDELMELTEIIHRRRNEHLIDSRWHRIEAITEVLEFMESRGLTGDLSHAGPLLVQDIWDYYPTDERQFGWKLTASMNARFFHNSDLFSQRDEVESYRTTDSNGVVTNEDVSVEEDRYYSRSAANSKELIGKLMLEWYRPLSWGWQFKFSSEAQYMLDSYVASSRRTHRYFDDNVSTSNSFEKDDGSYLLHGLMSFMYFLDGRTEVAIGSEVLFTRGALGDSTRIIYSPPRDSYPRNVGWNNFLNAEYRISRPTTLILEVNYYSEGTKRFPSLTSFEKQWGWNYSIGMEHYIF